MTSREIKLIRQSWQNLLGVDSTLLGDVFYSRLFFEEPDLEKMFKTTKEQQARKLVEMIDLIVSRLDRLHEVSQEIKEMAERHQSYGVKPKHYGMVGKALIWTIKNGMGKDWNQELEDAWIKCYSIMTGAMLS